MINVVKCRPLLVVTILLVLSPITFSQAVLPASPVKTVYISPSSHYDLGFVEPPDKVRERAARHIDEVIRVAESDPNFRWTIESVWQVEEWLKRARKPTSVLPADREKIARLMTLIKSGQIALSTSWGSMHTDFMGDEELNRICYGYASLHSSFGVTSDLAMMDDVPGHPTTVPSVLSNCGTKYLVTGANLFLQDATSVAPGDVPFYWESPDGGKVLTWISKSQRGGYTEGMTDFFVDPYSLDPYTDKTPFEMFHPELAGKMSDLEVMEIGITELLNRYNAASYKYDSVLVMYGHDFVEPTNVANLERAARLWNSKHKEVELKIATPKDFFTHIEDKYRSQLKTYRGEWSGLWSEAKTRSPRISALARYSHDHIPAAETLWSGLAMTRQVPMPVGNFTRLYNWIFSYDEHSGAGNNGWPQLNNSESLEAQNREYVRDMTRASDEVQALASSGIDFIAQPTRWTAPASTDGSVYNAVVYNGTSWNRSDVVRLDPPSKDRSITSIRDAATGSELTFDLDRDGSAVLIAKDVPAFGYTTLNVTTAKARNTVPSGSTDVRGSAIRNSRWSIDASPDGTIRSIRDIKSGREMVNANGQRPFNDLLRVEGSEASAVAYPVKPLITVSNGRVRSTLTISRERSFFATTTITIYNDIDRVEIHNELDPQYEGYVGGKDFWGDSYYFAFPFALSAKGLKVMREGQKWFDDLPSDYLPGARKDSVSTQHSIALTDGANTALVLHRQAFHWAFPGYVSTKVRDKNASPEFPPMYTGSFPLPEATLFSRALRNASIADTHDLGNVFMTTVEPGMTGNYTYDYAVRSMGRFDPVDAKVSGAAFNVPLTVRYVQALPSAPRLSFFSTDAPNVQIVTVKPFEDNIFKGEVSASPLNPKLNKAFVVRLQEFAGKDTTLSLSLPAAIKSASVVSLDEGTELRKLTPANPIRVSIRKFETLTLKVEMQ